MPRLTADQWESIRAEREAGGMITVIAAKYGISHQAILKRSRKEGWSDGADVQGLIRRRAEQKVASVPPQGGPKNRAEAIDAAAEETAAVVRRHRQEWIQVVKLRQEALSVREHDPAEAFTRAKLAKITAEMTAIQQSGERKAWGLDEMPPEAIKIKWVGTE